MIGNGKNLTLAHYLTYDSSLQTVKSRNESVDLIEAELKDDINNATEDIEACANACNAYSKTRRLVKVFKSGPWEKKFTAFFDAFAKHRVRFNQVLTKHIAESVHAIREDIKDMSRRFEEILTNSLPKDLVELRDLVKDMGGVDFLLANPERLEDLIKKENKLSSDQAGGGISTDLQRPFTVQDLKEQLKRDIEDVLKTNLDTFKKGFELSLKQQQADLPGGPKQTHGGGDYDRIQDTVCLKIFASEKSLILNLWRNCEKFGKRW